MSMKKRPVLLTPEQMQRIQELEQLLLNYKTTLDLEKENIEVGISAKNNAFLHWYEKEKKWGIYLLPSDNDFTPIHELGHIFLARKTNYPFFARSGVKRNIIFEGLLKIVNSIVDCFVDYNLIQFDHLYELYIDDAHLWRHAKEKRKLKGNLIDLVHSYNSFVANYLSLKIINFGKDRRYYIDLKNYLRRAKTLIQETFPNIKFNFHSFEEKLDYFNKIKTTKDHKKIINFIYNILDEISLWKEEDIKKQLKLLFPKIII